MKLKKKLILLFTALTVIPLTFVTIFAYSQFVHIINRYITSFAENQFETLSRNVRESYLSIRENLGFLAFYSLDENSALSTLRHLDSIEGSITSIDLFQASRNVNSACQAVMYNNKYIENIFVFTSGRSMFVHARSDTYSVSGTYDPVSDNWYQETLNLNGSIYISPLDIYPISGRETPCFLASQLIRDVDRNFEPLGVIVLEYSAAQFDLDQENALTGIAQITLTNTLDGSVIYTNQGDSGLNIEPAGQNSFREKIFGTPLELSMTVDFDSLKSEYNHTLILLLALALFSIVCILLTILWLSRSFIEPIQELSDLMVAKQALSSRGTSNYENRKDEIGIMYRQYDNMIREINNYIKTEYQNKLITLDAQMKALEARINSHFLFNTLESINSMAELADQPQISTMSLALGHMFRYAIKTDSELVTIREELNHVQDYITIQKIRCDNQFQFLQDVPEELYDQRILKLIFQPIVENSLSHGLKYGSAGDTISLSVRQMDNQLWITITDNGQGISEEELILLQKHLRAEASFTELGHREKESIGLKNIQSRIELYYGKGYGLTVSSQQNAGVQIRIRIPVFPDRRGMN